MHELSLMQSLVATVEEAIEQDEIFTVHLEVGALTCVAAEALQFCFEACARGTRLQGAELAIHRIPARIRCRACGGGEAVDSFFAMCRCGSIDVDVIAGRELRVRDVEVA